MVIATFLDALYILSSRLKTNMEVGGRKPVPEIHSRDGVGETIAIEEPLEFEKKIQRPNIP